jgi:hypothetical protein
LKSPRLFFQKENARKNRATLKEKPGAPEKAYTRKFQQKQTGNQALALLLRGARSSALPDLRLCVLPPSAGRFSIR